MTVTASKTCLLIMPRSFYSFAKLFSSSLEELGYTVTLANDEFPENPVGKIMGKLDLGLSRTLTRNHIRKAYLEGKHYDLAMIVKGRGIGPALVGDLQAHCGRVVGYHFDALSYDKATERWAVGCDRVTTFDYADAHRKSWPVVELFATEPPPSEAQPIAIRFSAIMRNHSNRLRYLDEVVRALGVDRPDLFVYIFEQDLRSLAFNFLRQPRLYWRWRRSIHRTPLAYDDYRRVLATSDFTIDYAHPKQTGLTMRCFEALSSGAKIITNNPWIEESPRFGPECAVVFRTGDDPSEFKRTVARRAGERPKTIWRSVQECLKEIIDADESAEAV